MNSPVNRLSFEKEEIIKIEQFSTFRRLRSQLIKFRDFEMEPLEFCSFYNEQN